MPSEKLLIQLTECTPSMKEYRVEEIAKYDIGDIHIDSFNEYRVTRKDSQGMWGVLIDSSVREMDISEV